jgi:hypothetical protein
MRDFGTLATITFAAVLFGLAILSATRPVFFPEPQPTHSSVVQSPLQLVPMKEAQTYFENCNAELEAFRDEAVAQAVMVKGYIVEQNLLDIPTEIFEE